MVDINKATNQVPRANGLKYGNANIALTTPNPTFGKYSSGYVAGKDAVNEGQIFSKNTAYSVFMGKDTTGMKP